MTNSKVETLVILAAGRGSRFGGAKQFHPFGRLKKTLMEYNICHAIKNGFKEVVFITQQIHGEQLISQVINHLPTQITSSIVFQNITDLPEGCFLADSREKPLGTAHALWCARDAIKGNFVVINADDYYGQQAFALISAIPENYSSAIVAYQLTKTLSENGGVNRGICQLSENNELLALSECENIQQVDHKIRGELSSITDDIELNENTLVSMNFWYFNQQIFPLLKQLLLNTFKSDSIQLDSADKKECYLPDVIALLNNNGEHPTKVLTSHDAWFGVTYAADSDNVNNKLTGLADRGLFSALSQN
ncbi:MAG: sugar phosphate nucleotidyltransferase [Thalassotalea sp.]|nr:sugar phosphate nucleotidyltransferase [Thalassotalea sp.]